MAAGRPAGCAAYVGKDAGAGMVDSADKNCAASILHLGMAAQAEVIVGICQHLPIDGTMRIMTRDTAFTHRLVFEDKGPCLFTVTLGARLILSRHRQPTRRFENVRP